jgi:hypothetical protein
MMPAGFTYRKPAGWFLWFCFLPAREARQRSIYVIGLPGEDLQFLVPELGGQIHQKIELLQCAVYSVQDCGLQAVYAMGFWHRESLLYANRAEDGVVDSIL